MEEQLKKILNLQEVVIVAGDSDETPWVKGELGRACAIRMKEHLDGKNIIAVTGGTTMATVADMLTTDFAEKEIVFVPARGGIGEDVKNQANTICAKMAENTGSQKIVFFMCRIKSVRKYMSL